ELRKSFNLGRIKPDDFLIRNGQITTVNFEKSIKYSRLFMEAVIEEKEAIYRFVHEFYRYAMNKKKNSFPHFTL
ncbi:MAG: hypothetical protein AAB893_03520, partial [Patescibacteria group bacterium]